MHTNKTMNKSLENKVKYLEELQKKLIDSEINKRKLIDFSLEMLKKNLECFKKFYPNIYKKFSNFVLKNYKLVCFIGEEPNVLNLKTGTLLYSKDPYTETREQVEDWIKGTSTIRMKYSPNIYNDEFCQFSFNCCNNIAQKAIDIINEGLPLKEVPSVVPNVILIGGGLGFPISEIYSHTSAMHFFYIEPDEDLFYCSLCLFDWDSIINYIASNSFDLRFIIGQTVDDTISSLETFYLEEFPYALGYQVILQHYTSTDCNEILLRIQKSSAGAAVRIGQFDDRLFGIANELYNLRKEKVIVSNPLPKEYKNFPIIVVGNGPSLDNDLDTLKLIQDKCIIVACGTAFNSLVKYGINPDIYVAIERITNVSDSLKQITNTKVFEDTLCITPDLIHHKTLDLFKQKLIFFKNGENLLDDLPISFSSFFKNFLWCRCVGPLVSNCGLSVAMSLGFTNIYMVGIDNGSVKDYGHSKYSSYYDNNGFLKKNCQNMILEEMDLETIGNFSKKVKTNFLFLNSIYFIELLLSHFTNVKLTNCSDGAFIKGARSKHLSNIKFENSSLIKKNAIIESIKSNSLKIDECNNLISYIKNPRTFDIVADNIFIAIHRNINKLESREDCLLLINNIMTYINNQDNNDKFAKNLLKGTIASMFADFISVLYSNIDEKKLVQKLKPLFNEVERFLKGSRKIYQNIDLYIQGEHQKFQKNI